MFAANFVKGLQGNHPRYVRANAGCKHFDVHGGPENIGGSRFGFNSVVRNLIVNYFACICKCIYWLQVQQFVYLFVCLVVFNATFNNILVIIMVAGNRRTWRKPPTCHKSLTNFITILYTSPWSRFELTTSVVIGTDCIGSCNSNYRYHTITAPNNLCFHYKMYLF